MKFKHTGLLLLACLLIGSCTTDFDTIAPYREHAVVYGLLNPNDSKQFIRISKAYLGEGNALLMAQQNDSVNYANVLDVTLERYLNNSLVSRETLTRIDTIPKDAGEFSYPNQVIYASTTDIPSDKSIYKLIVRNTETGYEASASTQLVENFSILHPLNNQKIDFTSLPDLSLFDIYPSESGKVYAMTMIIKYNEMNLSDSSVVQKSIRWYLGDKLSSGNSSIKVNFNIRKSQFFQLLNSNIAVDPGKVRFFPPNPIDVLVSGGTEELYTYMQVTQPSSGISQDRPSYTNINSGTGIFTSRNTRSVPMLLHQNTIAALDTHSLTRDLNFIQ